ncbi:nucleolin [Reticulomyxa filosa]|uniref:Nucleolin n=1 Tax=Reticulomyxa filosa TaxID=46433 RepID=X6NWJ8_RETFI|nr:nucleolin [Reticulomyxa filosa]|eukprot:ETO30204.1 nucleolin [Reticulomyxa filosa]
MSDDEDETNLGDVDLVDDHEKDEWTNEDAEDSSSEEDEQYKKLKNYNMKMLKIKNLKLLHFVPVKKDGENGNDADDANNEKKDDEALWSISDDEEEDKEAANKPLVGPGKRKKRDDEEGEDTAQGGTEDDKNKASKRRRLNDGSVLSGTALIPPKEDSKLQNLREDVLSILKKYAKSGIDTHDLWEKLRAIHSTEKGKFKEELAKILKEVGTRKPNCQLWFLKKQYQ